MPRADLAVRRAVAGERRPLRCPNPTWLGRTWEWPWPGSCVCSIPTPLGVHGRAVDVRTERWTEPAESQDHHIHRAHGGHSGLSPVRHCPGRRRRRGPAAGRRVRADPTLPPSGGRAWPGRGRAAARWFAAGRDRNDAAPAPSSTVPSTHPTGTSTDKPPGTPRPREPRPSRAPEPSAGIRPVGPPTAKGGCLVPCPVSVPHSSASSPRASC